MRNNPRDRIPALKNKYYFNYGGQGPLPKSSLEAIVKTWEIIQDLGPFTNDMWPFIYKEILTTKRIIAQKLGICLLYTSPSPRDNTLSRMPSSA